MRSPMSCSAGVYTKRTGHSATGARGHLGADWYSCLIFLSGVGHLRAVALPLASSTLNEEPFRSHAPSLNVAACVGRRHSPSLTTLDVHALTRASADDAKSRWPPVYAEHDLARRDK